MGRKVIAIWLCLAMLFGMIVIVDVTMDFTLNAKGTTHYVNTTGSGGAYISIQDAIDNASDIDTVFVYNGTYYERIVVNKSISLVGEDRNNTTIDGEMTGNVILINVDGVILSGFTVTRGGNNNLEAGIKLENVQNCLIYNNTVINCWGYYRHQITI
jgi:nitrous oxidase accessory protein NosD